MAISVPSNFEVLTDLPLDDRYIVADESGRNAIDSGVRYDGLVVYQQDTDAQWQLQNGTTNSHWVELGGAFTGNETLDGGTWS